MLNFAKIIYNKKITNCNTENNLIDINKEKFFISKLIKNNDIILNEKNTLLLMCILSSIVYEYKHEHTKNCNSIIDPIEIINKEMDEILTNLYSKCNIYSDNFNVYNIDNRLIFGIFIINKKLIISFKGSSTINDFVSDIQFDTVNCIVPDNDTDDTNNIILDGKVHKGAYDILFENNRYSFIIDKLNEFSKKNYNEIYITGHSLGGLTGTIFYAFIQKLWYKKNNSKQFHIPQDKCKLVTFGCPRPGDKIFCDSIKNSIRVVNSNDFVTKIPLPINYSHVQREYNIGYKKTNCLGFSMPSVKDHSINNYFISLSTNIFIS